MARPITPTTSLDATDGNLGLAIGGDQDRHVENPILLRPDEFLALDKQNTGIPLVLDQQVGNRPTFRDLFDGHGTTADALVRQQVFHRAFRASEKREDRKRFVANGLADADFRKRDEHGSSSQTQ